MPKPPTITTTPMATAASTATLTTTASSRMKPTLQLPQPAAKTMTGPSSSSTTFSSTRRYSTSFDSNGDDGDGVVDSTAPAAALALSSTSTTTTSVVETTPATPRVDPEAPFLYLLPDQLQRYYQPVPLLAQLLTVVLATWVAALTTWKRLLWLQPLYWLRRVHSESTTAIGSSWLLVGQMVLFMFKSITGILLLQAAIQEVFLPPSRVSMSTLLQKYFLPSPLSKYRQVTLPPWTPGDQVFRTGVHYLEYHNNNKNNDNTSTISRFDALYLQHGFGASSLSWLPAIPALAERMGARVVYGHDAPGFGFTDRPADLKWYTHRASASMAQQVLLASDSSSSPPTRSSTTFSNPTTKSVALMGHSMGALTILRLALDLPPETSQFIVLSSPALGIRGVPKKPPRSSKSDGSASSSSSSRWLRQHSRLFTPLKQAFHSRVLDPAGRYFLRRVVGTKGSWKTGLKAVWGDPHKVSESDVLRFSWPAIGLGWEDGILKFARAQTTHLDDDDIDELDNDKVLMQRVLERPNTKVAVILGSKDRIVPSTQIKKFLKSFPDVPVIELEGLGHDAFEEGTEAYCDAVERLLAAHWQPQQ